MCSSDLEVDVTPPEDGPEDPSTWVLCTRSEAAWRALAPHATGGGEGREVAWTDDRSDLFSVLKLR